MTDDRLPNGFYWFWKDADDTDPVVIEIHDGIAWFPQVDDVRDAARLTLAPGAELLGPLFAPRRFEPPRFEPPSEFQQAMARAYYGGLLHWLFSDD